MDTRESLLAAIGLDPEDDSRRLVFADWCEENGDSGRAEFIRLQVAVAKMPIDAPGRLDAERREGELLEEHCADWLKELPGWARKEENYVFHRGFLAELSLTEKRFLKGDDLFAVAPVEAVRLRRVERSLEALSASPHLARLRKLDLTRNVLGTEGLDRLAKSPHTGNLKELVLDENNVTGVNVSRLLKSKHLPRLERISLRRTLIGCLREIARTPEAAKLRGLEFYDNNVTDAGLTDLAASPHLTNLSDLGLGATRISTVGVRALGESPLMPRLRRLVLRVGELRLLGVAEALAASDHRLAELDFGFTLIASNGAVALAKSPASAHLRVLNLSGCRVHDSGAIALAESPHLAGIVRLDLSRNTIGEAGALALARSPYLERIQLLDMSETAASFTKNAGALRERFGNRVVM